MVNSAFDNIPSRKLATLCSEVAGDNFGFMQSPEDIELYGEGMDFITCPAIKLFGVQVCHAKNWTDGENKHPLELSVFGSRPPIDKISQEYSRSIGMRQRVGRVLQVTDILSAIPEFKSGWPDVDDMVTSTVADQGGKLAVAHFLGQIEGQSESVVSIGAYPRYIQSKIRTLIDANMPSILSQQLSANRKGGGFDVRNPDLDKFLGDVAACSLLLDPGSFSKLVGRFKS